MRGLPPPRACLCVPPQQSTVQGPGFSWLFQPRLNGPSHLLSPFLCCPGGSFTPGGRTTLIPLSLLPCGLALLLPGPQQCKLFIASRPMPSGSQFPEGLRSLHSGLPPQSKLWSLLWKKSGRKHPPVSASRGWLVAPSLCSPSLAPSLQASPLPGGM